MSYSSSNKGISINSLNFRYFKEIMSKKKIWEKNYTNSIINYFNWLIISSYGLREGILQDTYTWRENIKWLEI